MKKQEVKRPFKTCFSFQINSILKQQKRESIVNPFPLEKSKKNQFENEKF